MFFTSRTRIFAMRNYVTHAVKTFETLLCTWSKLSVWYIIKYILPFIMVVKILKLDNPTGSYAHLTFGVLKV